MKRDPVQEFVQLRKQLTEEKAALEDRLAKINQALSEEPQASIPTETPTEQPPAPKRQTRAAGKRRGRNAIPLQEMITQVLKEKGPLTKQEIFSEVEKRGYVFGGKDPMNSLGAMLYGNKQKFPRVDGKFGLR